MLWLVSLHLRRHHRFNGGSPRSFLVVIVGLWFVKWQPYCGQGVYGRRNAHSIDKSILASADTIRSKRHGDYAAVYFLAVWKAAVLGVLLGSLIQVLIPHDWLLRTLGQSRFRGTLSGVLFSLPGMMCAAAPHRLRRNA